MSNTLQPIETAPRDGTYILLFGDSGYMSTPLRCTVCRWRLGRWFSHSGDQFTEDGEPPTYWMPLPPLPPEYGV